MSQGWLNRRTRVSMISTHEPRCGALAREGVVAGPSGAAGTAALIALPRDESLREIREASRLGARSVVYAINTEGATDRALYESIIGKDPCHDSR